MWKRGKREEETNAGSALHRRVPASSGIPHRSLDSVVVVPLSTPDALIFGQMDRVEACCPLLGDSDLPAAGASERNGAGFSFAFFSFFFFAVGERAPSVCLVEKQMSPSSGR